MNKTIWLVHSVIRKHRLSLIHSSKVPTDKLTLNSGQAQKYNCCQLKFSARQTPTLPAGFVWVSGAGPLPYGILGAEFCYGVCVCMYVCVLFNIANILQLQTKKRQSTLPRTIIDHQLLSTMKVK